MSVVLITGCSTGIGLRTAVAFAAAGDTVVATMRNTAKAAALNAAAAEAGVAIEVVALDVTDDASVAAAVDDVLGQLEKTDPLLDIARELEAAALEDEYFIARKLYPNVDFYSGILLRSIGIPSEMFTVMFAIGRMPGWIANWKEINDDPKARIYRPRQVYVGPTGVDWVPRDER